MILTPLPFVTNCHTFSDPLPPSSVTYFMNGPLKRNHSPQWFFSPVENQLHYPFWITNAAFCVLSSDCIQLEMVWPRYTFSKIG